MAPLRAGHNTFVRQMVLQIPTILSRCRRDNARAWPIRGPYDCVEMDTTLCSRDQPADAAAPEDERNVIPPRRDLREGGRRVEIPLPRRRLRWRHHRIYVE